MNLLQNALPDSVMVDGRAYKIKTNYPEWIHFEQAMLDETLDDDTREAVINGLFIDEPPPFKDAVSALMWFYRCGKTRRQQKQGAGGVSKRNVKVFDYDFDADLLWAAYLGQYHRDINTERGTLHWWKFRAMFRGMNEGCKLVKVMEIRGCDTSKLKGDARRNAEELQKIWALPLPEGEQEEIDVVTEALMNGGDLSGIL